MYGTNTFIKHQIRYIWKGTIRNRNFIVVMIINFPVEAKIPDVNIPNCYY